MIAYLAKLHGYNIATSQEEVVYFSTNDIAIFEGNTYLPYIAQPAFFGQSISIDSQLGGLFSNNIGELVLTNKERALDYLTNYIFEGRLVELYAYDLSSNPATATLVGKQYIEELVFEWVKISVRLMNAATKLTNPLQPIKFLGNNTLPNGVEGNTDLKDKLKPLFFGRVSNVEGLQVNSSKLIYQISILPVEMLVNVMSNGALLRLSTNVISSFADFMSEDANKKPAAGEYTFYSGSEGSFFRLGMESGQVTWTAWEKINPASNTTAEVMKRVALQAGYSTGDISADDVTYINGINGDSVGVVVSENATGEAILTQLGEGAGVWWGFDSTNLLRMYYFGDFTQASVATVSEVSPIKQYGIISFDLGNAKYNGKPAPVSTVNVNYDRNYTVQDKSNLAGIVIANFTDRTSWYGAEWRTATSTTTTLYPNQQTITYDSCYISEFAAKAEATRRTDLLSPKRNEITAVMRLPVDVLKQLQPCKLLTIKLPRYGLDTGKDFIILSSEINQEDSTANLTLWG